MLCVNSLGLLIALLASYFALKSLRNAARRLLVIMLTLGGTFWCVALATYFQNGTFEGALVFISLALL
jgi:hypothetical protein